jgi:ribosomal protein S18 acetylase RimI-like enzyme
MGSPNDQFKHNVAGTARLKCGFWMPPITLKQEETTFRIRPATLADAGAVARCVNAAYRHYVERIGKAPGPMLEDYSQVITERQVLLAERDEEILGILVMTITGEGFLLDNVAVDPLYQGAGIGRTLLELAESEARRQGYKAIHLYTHAHMTENQVLYARAGYVEYDRRTEKGFARVYMRKHLK